MKLNLKDSLFLGFCAVFIVTAKAALRLHLKIPGHSMFFTILFLLVARGCVRQRLAATTTGLLAGLMTMLLGMGKGGPLLLLKFFFPALAIDLVAACWPGLVNSVPLCLLAAALAALAHALHNGLIDLLVGMDESIILQQALIKTIGSLFFAMAGAALVPAVIRRLKAHGVIDEN